MPPPRSSRRAPRHLVAIVAVTLAAGPGCAAPRPAGEGTGPVEVLVEVLPRDAELVVDGVPLGPGARTVRLRDGGRVHAFRAAAPGFEPAERRERAAALDGARIGLALRPAGSARPVDLDDAASLAGAAETLLAGGRAADAVDYAQRAVDMAPRAPGLRRLAAEAAQAAGDRARALAGWRAYLKLAPDAPDRAQVAARIEALRTDAPPPGVEVRHGPGVEAR